jgi:hypothetical protein
MSRIAAVIMHTSLGESPGERFVEQGREAATVDLISTLQRAGLEDAVLVTDDKTFSERLSARGVAIFPSESDASFHFGKTLKDVIRKYLPSGLIYFGSGSGGLLDVGRIRQFISFCRRPDCNALFNNFYSCDFAAIANAKTMLNIDLPAIDNRLGFVLSDAGIPCASLPRDVTTQFDIDTPTDLLLLASSGYGGSTLRSFLERQTFIQPKLSVLLERLVDRTAHIALIGRVNPVVWAHFEQEVACRTSVFGAGRGMRGYPDGRGTLLSIGLQRAGIPAFFETLFHYTDGAIIDTRPLLTASGELPPASDRFASDLFQPDRIEDPLWKTFTEEASKIDLPILLGGHSLVSGGLYLLSETCWKDHDLPRRLHPDTLEWEKERS